MVYQNIYEATFISRPNRFIAQVHIKGTPENQIEVVHVKNTGRCKELLIPGVKVYLEKSENPNRKTQYDLIAVEKIYPNSEKKLLVNMDSLAPNKLAYEWLKSQNLSLIKPEYTFGKSRIDFYFESHDGKKSLMEVKGCTLEIDGTGYFPDAPTERGVKHLRELTQASKQGYNCIIAFVIQMEGITQVLPNKETHPEFADALEEAEKSGVEILYLCCKVEPHQIEIIKSLWKNT